MEGQSCFSVSADSPSDWHHPQMTGGEETKGKKQQQKWLRFWSSKRHNVTHWCALSEVCPIVFRRPPQTDKWLHTGKRSKDDSDFLTFPKQTVFRKCQVFHTWLLQVEILQSLFRKCHSQVSFVFSSTNRCQITHFWKCSKCLEYVHILTTSKNKSCQTGSDVLLSQKDVQACILPNDLFTHSSSRAKVVHCTTNLLLSDVPLSQKDVQQCTTLPNDLFARKRAVVHYCTVNLLLPDVLLSQKDV